MSSKCITLTFSPNRRLPGGPALPLQAPAAPGRIVPPGGYSGRPGWIHAQPGTDRPHLRLIWSELYMSQDSLKTTHEAKKWPRLTIVSNDTLSYMLKLLKHGGIEAQEGRSRHIVFT